MPVEGGNWIKGVATDKYHQGSSDGQVPSREWRRTTTIKGVATDKYHQGSSDRQASSEV